MGNILWMMFYLNFINKAKEWILKIFILYLSGLLNATSYKYFFTNIWQFFLFSNSAVQTFIQWNLIATLKFFWSNLVEHPLEFCHQVCFFFFFLVHSSFLFFFFSENVSVGYMISPIMLYSESIVSNSTTILNEFLDEQKLTDSDYYNMSLLI